ncbi:MAG: hypothetical protein BroJett021_22750 [Chloroflexota bacterium]|nr:hypothetical protein [Caldilinea sp.]GIK73287.1 MAG: hypothetical protein BroJett021_22750 [Chloroflexota bacterium]
MVSSRFSSSAWFGTASRPWRAVQVLLTALLLLLASAAIAAAQALQPALSPAQVTIAGTCGAVEQRTILLRLPPDASDIRFVAQDLPTTDGTGVLPAAAIRADIPAAGVQNSTAVTGAVTLPLSMALTVDLREANSGAYTGAALVYYALPGSVDAPTPVRLTAETLGLTVNVKSPPWWPALVLVLGLALGLGLTTYREQMAPVDRLLVRLATVKNRLDGDAELNEEGKGAAFYTLANRALTDALTRLRAGDQQNAARLALRAETIVNLWVRERERWLRAVAMQRDLLKQVAELQQRLEPAVLAPAGAHLEKLRLLVEAADEDVLESILAETNQGDGTHAQKLSARLDELRARLRAFTGLAEKLIQIADKLAQQSNPDFNNLLKKVEALDAAAALTVYTDQVKLLYDEAAALLGAISAPKVREEPKSAATSAPGLAAPESDLFAMLLDAGMLPSTPEELKQDKSSVRRLRTLTLLSWAVALLLLCAAGFNQLYVTKATFGATPWTDYLGLFAWGFGVEVTRDAVVKMVQGWGIPAKSPTIA